MRVLLDTLYLYRFMEAPGHFSEPERRFLEEADARVYVSAVSVWELRLKHHARHRSGERKSPYDPGDVIATLQEQNVVFLPMSINHAARELETPIAHKDPFDELLLVQAQEEDLRLLTTDRLLVDHPLAITV